jgi:hypothetical protein
MPKCSATTLTFGPNAIAHQLADGPIVVADPDAPIEYGCRVLLTFNKNDAKLSGAFEARCETKHPAKAKWGITVSVKNIDGTEAGGLSRCPIAGSKRCVYRIVAEFPAAIPVKAAAIKTEVCARMRLQARRDNSARPPSYSA